jgi:threonine/homoserine/homoserine lactone efflux protein
VKNDTSQLHAWWLIVLYNLLFVFPLAVVCICFHRGMQINRLTDWTRRNLVLLKVILGLFFSASAILLLAGG